MGPAPITVGDLKSRLAELADDLPIVVLYDGRHGRGEISAVESGTNEYGGTTAAGETIWLAEAALLVIDDL